MNYRSIFKQNKLPLLLIALAFPVSVTTSSLYATTTEVTITQQKKAINGVVFDGGLNEPLIGANVVVKGTTNGTVTDLDGKFTLEATPNDILVISSIGFKSLEIKASDAAKGKITLQEDTQALDEVVVVGYGVQKKANLTGSVAHISAEAIESRSVASVSAALAGQIPGVTAIQSSGAPGSQTASITIRGTNSINGGSPLVIVDGVPGSMNTIDPQDIESLTVLKDAASSAIYGVQAANGVILITTKKGKKGDKARINYSGSVAWSSPVALLKFLGAGDYAMLYNEAVKNENPNAILPYTEEDIQNYRNGTLPDTDWYDETFKKNALETYHNLSINGGSEKTSYNASIGYTRQDGLIDVNKYDRFNGRISVDSDINKWLTAGLNVSGYRGTKNDGWEGYASLRQYCNRLAPIYPVYNDDGSFYYSGLNNPVAHLNNTGFTRQVDQQLNATAYAKINILPELNVKALFSVRNDTRNNEGFKKLLEYGTGNNTFNSGLREGYQKYYDWNWYTTQVLANYNKTFGKHSLTALAGFEQIYYNYKYTEATRKGGGNDELTESLNTLDKSSQTNKNGGHETARRSYFGRVQYDFNNKYLFEANLRADASSRFPKDSRWGYFPSVSAGWRITEESFVKDADIKWLSNLKIRAGWGQTGNEELSDSDIYPSIATYAYGSYMFGNSLYSTAYETRYVNSQLKWATVTNYEGAIEAGFLNNRLGFELAVYKKKTKDMLLYLPVQGVLGMDAPAQNAGSMQNTGFDLSLFHNNRINKDFSYAVNLNIAYVKNKITDMCGTEGENPDDSKYWYLEGYALGSFYGYEAIGYFNTEEELANDAKRTGTEQLGDIKYRDLNNDGKIDAANDRKVIGKDKPSWTGGLNIALYYKDFDFSAFFQGAFDVYGYYTGESSYAFYNSGKVLERHLDRWTPENHNASYPRITKDSQINFSTSSFWLQDASYVRLKNISLGYNIPSVLTQKIGIDKVKVYISGENLLTFSGLEGIDPEAPASNRGAYYGNVKKVSLGLKVSF
ncbi:SusC/RagA family TonB-linked outer membrane protein [Parabacteroides goldsteinii]|uniref:SusC/RagA family TonB-linked outer membrane protein n=1 Tax=Parabacteroides goldsteinii TaxID=328812 RepID=UPI00241CB7CD|nr:TonB-dependent receptor [Parabacteroides goldsteinii]